MGTKGEKTRQLILKCAGELFASKGYLNVTMKDICQITELSRGGLYRHYSDKAEIFRDMFKQMSENSIDVVDGMIANNIPADLILDEMFSSITKEMTENETSLSLAIYEYAVTEDKDFFKNLNIIGRNKWIRLIQYGVMRKEFCEVDASAVANLILYSYQGVRMWSRIIDIDNESPARMLENIKRLLVQEKNK